MQRRSARILKIAAVFTALLVVVAIAFVLTARSAWFREQVRVRLISEAEKATGGRVEIGSFDYDWKTLTFTVKGFTIHGTEAANEPPLFHADTLTAGLKVLSVWKKQVDLASILVDRPQVSIAVYPDGHTNIPKPRIEHAGGRSAVETLLDLAVRRFELSNGTAHLADKTVPLDARGEDLSAKIAYDIAGPKYTGEVSAGRVTVDFGRGAPVTGDVTLSAALLNDRVDVSRLVMKTGRSSLEAAGSVVNLAAPHASFDWKARVDAAELRVPELRRGIVDLEGSATYSGGDPRVTAKMRARGLAVAYPKFLVSDAAVDGNLTITPNQIVAKNLEARALGGLFRGQATLRDLRTLQVSGDIDHFSTATISQIALPYNGDVSGPVQLKGEIAGSKVRDFEVSAKLDVTPGAAPNPARGSIEVLYRQRTNEIVLGPSRIELPSSTVNVSGTLGQTLETRVQSTNLSDFLPAVGMIEGAPKQLPVTLDRGGTFKFEGTVSGPLDNPRIAGSVESASFSLEGRHVDRVRAQFQVASTGLKVDSLTASQGTAIVRGGGQLGLERWIPNDASPLKASIDVMNADLANVVRQVGASESPVSGTLDGSANLSGTFGAPEGTLKGVVEKPAAEGQQFDRARAEIRFGGGSAQLTTGQLELGSARLTATGSYQHARADWTTGDLRFDTQSRGFTLAQFPHVQRVRKDIDARVAFRANGTARMNKGEFRMTLLNGQIALQQISVANKAVGNLTLDAITNGNVLSLKTTGDLRGGKISGSGGWRLEGDDPGEGDLTISPIDFTTIQDLVSLATGRNFNYPIDGLVQASARFTGPLRKPQEMRARIEIPRLVVRASETRNRTVQEIQDLTLRNQDPIIVEAQGTRSLTIRSAKMVGKDTEVQIAGAVAFQDKSPWDLTMKGNLNLAMLRDFNPDIEASGQTVLDAQVRGSLDSPQLTGSLRFDNVSANLAGMPTGLDQASGVIRFQNSRANIDRFTAQVGGGTLRLGGFVGYTAGEAIYRLTGEAQDVRVRNEGVSITVSSALNLSGSSQNSLLAGSITVRKAGFTPRTDLGSLLAQYSKPIETPAAPNPILRSMQLDIHVDSTPGLLFQTSLTKDIQAEADLRLRGTPLKPSLLGRVSVNQGEIQFFGTNYTINRGEIAFYNPVKIEPVLDLDLQTTARGVLVSINFTGTLNKLNVSYRSDPPLQSNEIIALLAVGRAPGENPALASSQTTAGSGLFATGANSILGQAIAAPVSNRLQRFFGVSRLKIDPQLTDVTNVPQARLTLEQQISKDITLTYITTLNRSQEQVVRVQWDLNRQWSLIAIRDENGLFGVDFQYRKRLK